MRRLALAAVLLALPARADTPADRLAALRKAHDDAETAYFAAVKALPDTPAGARDADRLWGEYDRAQAGRYEAAVALAMADPRSDHALACLEFVLTIPRAHYHPAGVPAFDLAATFHADNPKVGRIVGVVGRYPPSSPRHRVAEAAADDLLKRVAAANPDRAARGNAKAGLAYRAYCRFAVAEYNRTKDADALAAAAEREYEDIAKNYSDCPVLTGRSTRTLGELAWANLNDLRTLRVGKTAPDIVGEDLDGKRFRLSETRGKVTLLVFWASWCGPCMAMVPQERRLAERYRGKPFVIVGVNGDPEREKGRAAAGREGMTWRSFWDGPDSPRGPIAGAWNVDGWPTIYVLDAAGVIRFRGVVRDDLDAAVAELLAELEKK